MRSKRFSAIIVLNLLGGCGLLPEPPKKEPVPEVAPPGMVPFEVQIDFGFEIFSEPTTAVKEDNRIFQDLEEAETPEEKVQAHSEVLKLQETKIDQASNSLDSILTSLKAEEKTKNVGDTKQPKQSPKPRNHRAPQ